jgi:hypothetical protein
MGGAGSGNWYRFDKKTTTDECHSVDVRYLHQEGLLTPGHGFSLRWSRAGREKGSIRCAVVGNEKPERVILTYRHRSGSGDEWENVWEPVSLDWTKCNFGGEAVVCLSRSGLRPEGSCDVWTGALLPVPSLLRSGLREPAGEPDDPCSSPGAVHQGAPRREREHDDAVPGEAKGDHHETYMRMFWEHHEAHMEQLAGMREWLDKIEKKVG